MDYTLGSLKISQNLRWVLLSNFLTGHEATLTSKSGPSSCYVAADQFRSQYIIRRKVEER